MLVLTKSSCEVSDILRCVCSQKEVLLVGIQRSLLFRSSQIIGSAWLLRVAESVTEAVMLSGSLQRLYRKAMALELDFFQAAVQEGRQPKVGLLVLDFDETLSVSDTTSVIIDTAIHSAGSQDNGEPFKSPVSGLF